MRRELRSSAEPAVRRVEHDGETGDRIVHGDVVERPLSRAADPLLKPLRHLRGGLVHVTSTIAERLFDVAQHVGEAGLAVAGLRREVRAGEERFGIRREEHRHRPSALTGERERRLHVERVDVRPLLAIDLDADEHAVHLGGDRVVLERFVGHDVAPVARRVADGEQDRLVLVAGALERLLAPRVPVDGCRRAGAGRGWRSRRGGWAWAEHRGVPSAVQRQAWCQALNLTAPVLDEVATVSVVKDFVTKAGAVPARSVADRWQQAALLGMATVIDDADEARVRLGAALCSLDHPNEATCCSPAGGPLGPVWP